MNTPVRKLPKLKLVKQNFKTALAKMINSEEEYVKKATLFNPSNSDKSFENSFFAFDSSRVLVTERKEPLFVSEKIEFYKKRLENTSFETVIERKLKKLKDFISDLKQQRENKVSLVNQASTESTDLLLQIDVTRSQDPKRTIKMNSIQSGSRQNLRRQSTRKGHDELFLIQKVGVEA